jgi:hypothetical protein
MHQDVLAAAFSLSAMQVLGTPASQLSTKLLEDPHFVVIWIRDPEASAGLFATLVSDCVAARHSGRLKILWPMGW